MTKKNTADLCTDSHDAAALADTVRRMHRAVRGLHKTIKRLCRQCKDIQTTAAAVFDLKKRKD